MPRKARDGVKIHHLTQEEAYAVFEKRARSELNMSAEEFLRALDAGEFNENADTPQVMSVLFLVPLVRRDRW